MIEGLQWGGKTRGQVSVGLVRRNYGGSTGMAHGILGILGDGRSHGGLIYSVCV